MKNPNSTSVFSFYNVHNPIISLQMEKNIFHHYADFSIHSILEIVYINIASLRVGLHKVRTYEQRKTPTHANFNRNI